MQMSYLLKKILQPRRTKSALQTGTCQIKMSALSYGVYHALITTEASIRSFSPQIPLQMWKGILFLGGTEDS